MKLTKQYLKNLIQEIFRINKDGEKEEFGPPEEIDQIERMLMQLRVEKEAMKKEKDEASKDRLGKIDSEIKD